MHLQRKQRECELNVLKVGCDPGKPFFFKMSVAIKNNNPYSYYTPPIACSSDVDTHSSAGTLFTSLHLLLLLK